MYSSYLLLVVLQCTTPSCHSPGLQETVSLLPTPLLAHRPGAPPTASVAGGPGWGRHLSRLSPLLSLGSTYLRFFVVRIESVTVVVW